MENLIYESDNKNDSDDWKNDFYFDKINNNENNNLLNKNENEYGLITNNNSDKNSKTSNSDNSHQINFITMNPSLEATDYELNEAKKQNYNKKLQETDLSYLLQLEKWKPRQYAHLYAKTIKFREKWKKRKMFAEYTCDRRTLNVEPCELGIKPEFRNSTVRVEQYPLNQQKRIQMIGYTTD